ncbi:MAG TPA: S-layer protein, partial [Synergistaceae bacterium]|nr:S-layer protein [Synergistaceae bacterium]
VENIDERLAVMEERLGGWQMYGQFRMDAKVGHDDNVYFWDTPAGGGALQKYHVNPYWFNGERETSISRYRIYLRKYINDTTTFGARIGGGDMEFEHYWVSTKLPWDINFTVGKFNMDWEDELGFYTDNDAWFFDYTTPAGFLFEKTWGMADLKFFLGHQEAGDTTYQDPATGKKYTTNKDATAAALRADFNFNEKFRFGLMGATLDADDDALGGPDLTVYNANFTVNFTPAIAFKGVYYMQDVDWAAGTFNYLGQERDGSPAGYRAILDVSQEAFGFTSLWLEYGHMDQDYVGDSDISMADVAYDNYGAYILANRFSDMDSTDVLFVKAKQQWNDKWSTFLRYVSAGYDRAHKDDTTNWTIGFGYQYNPAVYFELLYDNVDYGNNDLLGSGFLNDSDSLIRFRTHVYF